MDSTQNESADLVTATVNGIQYVIGGWGEYEINRLNAKSADLKDIYKDRTYITDHEFTNDVFNGIKKPMLKPFVRAARRLISAIDSYNDKQLDIVKNGGDIIEVSVPVITIPTVEEIIGVLKKEDICDIPTLMTLYNFIDDLLDFLDAISLTQGKDINKKENINNDNNFTVNQDTIVNGKNEYKLKYKKIELNKRPKYVDLNDPEKVEVTKKNTIKFIRQAEILFKFVIELIEKCTKEIFDKVKKE
jgi:hypothetical protein